MSTRLIKFATLCLIALTVSAASGDESTLRVGAGIYDITGPVAEAGMMGYAMLQQRAAGLHMRLMSRAFIFESPHTGKRVVFVSVDQAMICQGIKQHVVAKLAERFGKTYTERNVLLSATHTHSGPGGYSHYTLYNLISGGYDRQNFRAIVKGIFHSMVRAHDNLAPGRILIASGHLTDASYNRSLPAYLKNPVSERAKYAHAVDTKMTLLRLESADGRELGMINWFPVHTTSLGNSHRLVSSDNKGYASYLFERAKKGDHRRAHSFVAAFSQANEGDASPNLWGTPDHTHDHARNVVIGRRQYHKAVALYDGAHESLTAEVDHRHSFIDFSKLAVRKEWTAGHGPRKLGMAALGLSKVAGAPEDGPGLGAPFKEGLTFGPHFPFSLRPELQPLHGKKLLLLVMGRQLSHPWTPEVLPLQILRIGQLAIVGAPFELTTMTGRRIRETEGKALTAKGVRHLVIAGLANAYAGYVATREEYEIQHYEGASTHFGPYTGSALRQEYHALADALVKGTPSPPGPTPRKLSPPNHAPGVFLDDIPSGKRFGSVDVDAAAHYTPGKTVRVTFWGGHPRNHLRTQGSFLEMQRKVDGKWHKVADDHSPNTRLLWRRKLPFFRKLNVVWKIPEGTPAGIYRIQHDGHAKHALTMTIKAYRGRSSEFHIVSDE